MLNHHYFISKYHVELINVLVNEHGEDEHENQMKKMMMMLVVVVMLMVWHPPGGTSMRKPWFIGCVICAGAGGTCIVGARVTSPRPRVKKSSNSP